MFNGLMKELIASYKFIQKLWVLKSKIIEEIETIILRCNNELEKFTNKFIKEITHNLENFTII